jgi:hypothetical protein
MALAYLSLMLLQTRMVVKKKAATMRTTKLLRAKNQQNRRMISQKRKRNQRTSLQAKRISGEQRCAHLRLQLWSTTLGLAGEL